MLPALAAALLVVHVRAGGRDPPSPPTGGFPDSGDECQSAAAQPNWPTFHIVNNVTKHADGHLSMENLNDANAVFEYKGIYHVMNQAGGGNWTHAISNDLVHWFHIADALGRGPKASTWDDQGACDGTVSFPDLGKAPYDGTVPILMYGPDCGRDLPPGEGGLRAGAKSGDAARIEVCLPKEPESPYVTDWIKTQPGPVHFEGTPCSFPGRVWKSKVGNYWNMLCALNGGAPWVRYTSNDSSLMHWKEADTSFTKGIDKGAAAGALFHKIPGAPAAGPTHMINANTGSAFYLGTYDSTKEIMTVTSTLQIIESGKAYNWAASGNDGPDPDTDIGRLLTVAWVSVPWAPSVISLVRSMSWDAATKQLVTYPVNEYETLRNATFVSGKSTGAISSGSSFRLDVPTSAGGALDVLASFNLAAGQSGFGVAVRSGDVRVEVENLTKTGTGFIVNLNFFGGPVGPHPPPPQPSGLAVLPFIAFCQTENCTMNNTDLSHGTYQSTHMPAGTDPHRCQTMCLADPMCEVWVYVIRGQPAGSGDCLFKSEAHTCPSANTKCTAGRGHEPIGHNCYHPKPSPPPGPTKATLKVLTGETLDIRVLVDRSVVEIFANKGRAAFVSADNSFHENHTKVALFNSGKAPVTANVSAFGMGCGWTKTKPTPKPPARDA